MKSSALYWVFAIVALVLFAAIYWIEININPGLKFPPAPTPPAQDAYDYLVGAASLDRDSDKWTFAMMNLPPSYKDPMGDPDYRHYSFAEQKALLAENLPMLAKIRQGLALPFVPRPAPLFDFSINSKFREEARLMNFAAKVYDEEGDWNQAITCNLDAVQLGEDTSHDGGIIDRLTGIACEAIGRNRAWRAIDHLSAAQARGAALRLENIQASVYPLPLVVENDKWKSLAMIDHVFYSKGMDGTVLGLAQEVSMSGGPTWKNYTEALGTSKRAVVADYSQYMDRFAARSRYSYGQSMKMPPIPRPSNRIVGAITPDMEGIWLRDADNETQNDLLIVSLVLRAYKLDHGRYPASLSQLAPAYLAAVPADPFAAGGPLKYRTAPTGYTLYSVGPDGIDDGGKPIIDPARTGRTRYLVLQKSKGDIVAGVNTY